MSQLKKDSIHAIYLALGSNLGNKRQNIEKALHLISLHIGEVRAVSSFFETKPQGFESDNYFINAACLVFTTLSFDKVLEQTKDLEKQIGRVSKSINHQYADRIIDIDILLYDDIILNTAELTIPHPELQNRMFVLSPLVEIASQVVHPILGKTIKELFQMLKQTEKSSSITSS